MPGRAKPELDCRTCAACCRHAFEAVSISPQEPIIDRYPQLVVFNDGRFELGRSPHGRCSALSVVSGDGLDTVYACTVYDDRPQSCRLFERGSERCLDARRRIGLDL